MVTVWSGFDRTVCLNTAAAIEADLARLTADLTEAQFHAPPRTGGWSVAYCIEHLVLTGEAFLPKWDLALREGPQRPNSEEEAFHYSWWQRRFLEFLATPGMLKLKAPPRSEPCCRYPRNKTIERFLHMHQEFASRVSSSRGLDLKRTKVRSPFIHWVRYAAGFSFDLTLAHERRHLEQAWRIRHQMLEEP
jgi:hypothetical protein